MLQCQQGYLINEPMNEPMILAAISVLPQGNNLKLETRDVDHLELWINS